MIKMCFFDKSNIIVQLSMLLKNFLTEESIKMFTNIPLLSAFQRDTLHSEWRSLTCTYIYI